MSAIAANGLEFDGFVAFFEHNSFASGGSRPRQANLKMAGIAKSVGGDVENVNVPDLGIYGSSHS